MDIQQTQSLLSGFNFSLATIIIGTIAGIIGWYYFSSGRRNGEPSMLIAGIGLFVVPMFIGNEWVLGLLCAVLVAAPFAWRKYA